jgi:hypothetical protein
MVRRAYELWRELEEAGGEPPFAGDRRPDDRPAGQRTGRRSAPQRRSAWPATRDADCSRNCGPLSGAVPRAGDGRGLGAARGHSAYRGVHRYPRVARAESRCGSALRRARRGMAHGR